MTRRLTAKNALKTLTALSVLLYILSRIIIIFILNKTLGNLYTGKLTIGYLEEKKILYALYYLLADIVPLIIAAIILSPFIKKFIAEFSRKHRTSYDSIILDQQKEIEKQNKLISNLTNLYNDAVEYNTIKTEFFSNISHDLKTPLSVILGAVQLIDQKNTCGDDDKKVVSRHFKTIKQNCYRLVRLINNILDITRIESGYIKMNMSNCNIVYLIEEITQSISPYAEQKGISLEFDTEFEEIITAVDMDKIERIILNLLSNAIKFTPSGGKISVIIKGMNERIFVSVKDTGPGIPYSKQAMIFERFKQLDNSFTREFEGTGIGLSLVKSFVELHDGSIRINSEEGKGSEFIMELPVKLTEESSNNDSNIHNCQSKIIEAINIEFSDVYSIAS